MRSFLQKKAGATYFGNSTVTVSIRKHNLEFIFSLKGGWHAVVSVLPMEHGVVLMACLGNFAEQIDKLLPDLRLKPGDHPKFIDILEGKSQYGLLKIDIDDKGLESGICKELKGLHKPHLQLLGNPDVQKEASKLFDHTLSLYFELDKSPYEALKSLTNCFYD